MNDAAVADPAAAAIDRSAGAIAVALFREIAASAAPDEAAGLLQALGARIADGHPVSPSATVGALQDQLSARFAALDWGACTLTPTDRSLDITHRGWPRPQAPDAAADWQAGFPIVLAAVYGRWFTMLGAPAALAVRVAAVTDTEILLRQS